MTTITINAETIAKLEAAGFNRWTKGNMDRLYVNAQTLGLEVSYYKTGNVSSATWQGERISNADARRLLATKFWIDLKTGECHVHSDYNDYCDEHSLEDILTAYVEGILAPEPEHESEPEATETEEETDEEATEDAESEADMMVAIIARYLDREMERERRNESEYRAEGSGRMADAAHERAFAYECAHSFVLGVLDGPDAENFE